jgi:uncharacterized protein (DUF3820 family)
MIIPFGRFKGLDISDTAIPDSYVKWMALRGSYQEPGNRFETKWKVPIVISIEARREMERREYRRVDDHYEREE